MASSPAAAAGAAASRKKLVIFDAEEDLAASVAKHTAELSEKFAGERGAFTVVLSGGSLVKALRYLDPSSRSQIPWSSLGFGSWGVC
jgi:6-phosphogluconolactonase